MGFLSEHQARHAESPCEIEGPASKDKLDADIGEVLGAGPRRVDKHPERVRKAGEW